MADNLIDLGSTSIFSIDVNWANPVTPNNILDKNIVGFKGTSNILNDFVPISPDIAKFSIILYTMSQIHSFLAFYNSMKGRANKFWFKIPWRGFTLKTNISSGSTAIPIYRNELQEMPVNNQRIWIGMNNDDVITRKYISVTDDIAGEKHTLNIVTPLDRDLEIDNHYIIAKLLLCRFISDSLTLTLDTDSILRVQCEVIETIKEYGDV